MARGLDYQLAACCQPCQRVIRAHLGEDGVLQPAKQCPQAGCTCCRLLRCLLAGWGKMHQLAHNVSCNVYLPCTCRPATATQPLCMAGLQTLAPPAVCYRPGTFPCGCRSSSQPCGPPTLRGWWGPGNKRELRTHTTAVVSSLQGVAVHVVVCAAFGCAALDLCAAMLGPKGCSGGGPLHASAADY
jgi:hypothetical protein